MTIFLFLFVASYLIGSIPFGLLLAKVFGIEDLRQKGSGNIGATNALRVGGKKLGILTLIFDAIKGVIPIIIAQFNDFEIQQQAIIGLVAVMGHVFPIWLKFKGGKGVATTLAVLTTLDIFLGGAMAILWLSVFAVTKISSLSSLVSILCTALFSIFVLDEKAVVGIVWVLATLVFYKHKENIKRLIKKQEKKV